MERKKGRYCYSICRQPLLYFPSDVKHVETTKTAITKHLSPRKKRKGMLFFDNYLKDLLVWYKTKYMLGSNCIVNRYIFNKRSKNFMIFLSNFLYSHVFLQNFNKYFFFWISWLFFILFISCLSSSSSSSSPSFLQSSMCNFICSILHWCVVAFTSSYINFFSFNCLSSFNITMLELLTPTSVVVVVIFFYFWLACSLILSCVKSSSACPFTFFFFKLPCFPLFSRFLLLYFAFAKK